MSRHSKSFPKFKQIERMLSSHGFELKLQAGGLSLFIHKSDETCTILIFPEPCGCLNSYFGSHSLTWDTRSEVARDMHTLTLLAEQTFERPNQEGSTILAYVSQRHFYWNCSLYILAATALAKCLLFNSRDKRREVLNSSKLPSLISVDDFEHHTLAMKNRGGGNEETYTIPYDLYINVLSWMRLNDLNTTKLEIVCSFNRIVPRLTGTYGILTRLKARSVLIGQMAAHVIALQNQITLANIGHLSGRSLQADADALVAHCQSGGGAWAKSNEGTYKQEKRVKTDSFMQPFDNRFANEPHFNLSAVNRKIRGRNVAMRSEFHFDGSVYWRRLTKKH
jgi:hypothetical protein